LAELDPPGHQTEHCIRMQQPDMAAAKNSWRDQQCCGGRQQDGLVVHGGML
jgi:hypothetical protein